MCPRGRVRPGRGRGEGGAVGRSYSHSTGTTRSHTCRLHLTLPAPPPPFVRSYSGGPRPRSQGSGSLDGVRCQAADRQLCQFTRKSIRFDTVAFKEIHLDVYQKRRMGRRHGKDRHGGGSGSDFDEEPPPSRGPGALAFCSPFPLSGAVGRSSLFSRFAGHGDIVLPLYFL